MAPSVEPLSAISGLFSYGRSYVCNLFLFGGGLDDTLFQSQFETIIPEVLYLISHDLIAWGRRIIQRPESTTYFLFR